jgi:hypothetical protein
MRTSWFFNLSISVGLALSPLSAKAQAGAPASSGDGRYVEAPAAGAQLQSAAAPEPQGFRLNAKICAAAARQNDPLAQTAECRSIVQATRAQADACKRAFETGDDAAVLSVACRQAAMGR